MNEKSTKKKCLIAIVYIGVLLFIAILFFFIYQLNDDVNKLKVKNDHLESKMSDVISRNSISKSQELDYYSQITDSTVSNINSAVGVMGIAATLFGLLGILLTVFSYMNYKSIEESQKEFKNELEKRQKDSEKRIEDSFMKIENISKRYQSELDEIHIIQHILSANMNRSRNKTDHAITEYMKAAEIDRNNCSVLYELGCLFADDYVVNGEERNFDMADYYLKKAIECCQKSKTDNGLLSDCNIALGVIYGTKANKAKEDNLPKADTLFDDSITFFRTAIEYNKYNIDVYPNLALTYIYKEDFYNAFKCFKDALEMDRENVMNNNVIRRYYSVNKLLAILKKKDDIPELVYEEYVTDFVNDWKDNLEQRLNQLL